MAQRKSVGSKNKRAYRRAAAGITRPEHILHIKKNPSPPFYDEKITKKRCLTSRLVTMNSLQSHSMVLGEIKDTSQQIEEKTRLKTLQENKRKEQELIDQKRIEIENRKKSDLEEVEKSRAEWLAKKKKLEKENMEKKLKELEKKKASEREKIIFLEMQVGGKEEYRRIAKAAFHRDEFVKLAIKMEFHLEKYSIVGVDKQSELQKFFPATDKLYSNTMYKQAIEMRAEMISKLKYNIQRNASKKHLKKITKQKN